MADRLGIVFWESFPYPELALAATIGALFLALLILTTQGHADELAEKRSQLTPQIAVLKEKKIAKAIALLEEQRRDNPMLTDLIDEEASRLAEVSNPTDSLARIEKRTLRPVHCRRDGETAHDPQTKTLSRGAGDPAHARRARAGVNCRPHRCPDARRRRGRDRAVQGGRGEAQ